MAGAIEENFSDLVILKYMIAGSAPLFLIKKTVVIHVNVFDITFANNNYRKTRFKHCVCGIVLATEVINYLIT